IQKRHRAIRTHAARVGAFIVGEQLLVVLGRGQQPDAVAIRQADEADFGTGQLFFEQERKPAVVQAAQIGQRVAGLGDRAAHVHALAGGQAVVLDNYVAVQLLSL
nr:hypothetical protein [Tanacetum cinerariifolium]